MLEIGWLILIALVLFCLALIYIQVAKRYHIVDRPNERSSHQKLTIRGGGILFLLAVLSASFLIQPFPIAFFIATLMIGGVSFIDDLIQVSSAKRLFFQLVAVSLVVFTWPLDLSIALYVVACIVLIIIAGGVINIYNFMDGINGLNPFYTFTLAAFLLFLDSSKESFYLIVMIACLVMMFFNMRPQGKAIFFSGDVGSVSAGLFAFTMVIGFCIKNENPLFILLLAVYLADGIWTIMMRLLKGENIFTAHRSHLYQLLTNQLGWSHVTVTFIYVAAQIFINLLFLMNYELQWINDYSMMLLMAGFLTIIYQFSVARIGFLIK